MSLLPHRLEKCGMVAVKGGDIHYRAYFPNNPEKAKNTPLLVIHGGPGASHVLLYTALHSVANERPVVFYDQLGSYFSPAPTLTDDLLTLERFTDEALTVLNKLEIPSTHILGHSWGGCIAIDFAATHTDRVEKLILSNPPISTEKWIADCLALADKLGLKETILYCEARGEKNSPAYREAEEKFMAAYSCRLPEKPDILKIGGFNANIYKRLWGTSEFSCNGLLKNLDQRTTLPKIKAETLLLCGEFSTATPETMREAQLLIHHASVEVIKDAGHLAFLDNNESYLETIHRFLESS